MECMWELDTSLDPACTIKTHLQVLIDLCIVAVLYSTICIGRTFVFASHSFCNLVVIAHQRDGLYGRWCVGFRLTSTLYPRRGRTGLLGQLGYLIAFSEEVSLGYLIAFLEVNISL